MGEFRRKQRVFVGSPRASRALRYQDFEDARVALIKDLSDNGFEVRWADEPGAVIPHNRNNLVKHAIANDCGWVLQIDDDMVFQADAARKLMEHGKDIISGLCVKRRAPFFPVVLRKSKDGLKYDSVIDGWPRKGLMEVDAVGGAFLMVDTNVYKRIPFPWFAMPPHPTSGVQGEDIFFSEKAKEHGFKIHVDCELNIGHIGDHGYTIDDYLIAKKNLPKTLFQNGS